MISLEWALFYGVMGIRCYWRTGLPKKWTLKKTIVGTSMAQMANGTWTSVQMGRTMFARLQQVSQDISHYIKGYNLSFGNQETLQDQFKMAKDIVWPAMMTWYLRATSATEFPRPKETPTKRRQSFGVRQKWTAGIYKQLPGVHYEKLYSIMVHNFQGARWRVGQFSFRRRNYSHAKAMGPKNGYRIVDGTGCLQ